MIQHSTDAPQSVRHCEGSTAWSPGLPVAISSYGERFVCRSQYANVEEITKPPYHHPTQKTNLFIFCPCWYCTQIKHFIRSLFLPLLVLHTDKTLHSFTYALRRPLFGVFTNNTCTQFRHIISVLLIPRWWKPVCRQAGTQRGRCAFFHQ